MLRPLASSARARARTSNAVSVPSRPIRRASGRMSASLDLALDAGASFGTDERGVSRPGGNQHPIARLQRQRAAIAKDEIDRPGRAVEKLVVRVSVLLVTVCRSVRPSINVAGLGPQPFLDIARFGRGPAMSVDEHVHVSTIRDRVATRRRALPA